MFRIILLTALAAVTQARLLHQEEKAAHMRSAVDEQLQGLRDNDGGGVGADWCANPVKKGKVVFPEPLVGRAQVNFDMYAGYVNVTQADYLYYWYFSAIDQNPNAPLVIWTNGGPGCSSMEGATTENGPLNLFDIKESCEEGGRGADQTCDYTGQLSSNQYAWNNHAHVVYVDQPRFVGNSGGGKGSEGVHSSVDAAQDFVTFYKGLMEIFPEFVDKELIIAGESYGGHYIPAFAQALLDENSKNGGSIPFSGAVIGNGCVNDTVQNGDRYVDFAHAQNLIPEGSDPHGQAAASAEMEKFLGYTPNYYDFRLQSIPCRGCFGYDYNAWSHWFIQPAVKEAMHICGNAGDDAFAGTAGGCINVYPFDQGDTFDYSAALANTLDAGIPVTFYYGKADTACNYVGGAAMANSIPWEFQDKFAGLELSSMEIAGAEAGQEKTYEGLTWLQVEGAGHMVGLDQGAASHYALETLVRKYRN